MTQNPPPPHPPPSAAGAIATVCGHCCSDDRWILHNVRLRGLYRKLCTSCVLKLHPTLFCPTCFSLHDAIPLPSTSINNGGSKTLTCFKCSSLSHSTCVPPNVPKSPYLCPPCSNPSFKFFDFRRPKKGREGQYNGGDCLDSKKGVVEEQVLDERAAKVFLAAARIAAISMNKAAAVVKVDAERRVKEAAVARKRAKEAIDHVMALSARFSMMGTGNRRPAVNASPVSMGSKGLNVGVARVEKNGVMMGRANNGASAAVLPVPEIKNAGRLSTDGPVPVPVGGQSAPPPLQNSCNISDKNHGSGGGGTGPEKC